MFLYLARNNYYKIMRYNYQMYQNLPLTMDKNMIREYHQQRTV